MIDRDVITEKIGYIEENLKRLDSFRDIPEKTFLENHYYVGAAKYYIQTCVEAMLDINHHVIARQRYRAPGNYADSFRVLGEQGILPGSHLDVFYQMARFRNRIVHLYDQADDKEVYKILMGGPEDFRVFTKAILSRFFS